MAKKINGKLHYFGRWDDSDGALAEYQAKFSTPIEFTPYSVEIARLSLLEACNRFLVSKKQARDRGELAERSYKEYYHSCKRLLSFLGRETFVESLQPQDFARYRQDLAAPPTVQGLALHCRHYGNPMSISRMATVTHVHAPACQADAA